MKPRDIFSSLFHLTRLFTQMIALLIIYKNRSRKAKKSFKQQLIESGLSRTEAEELAKVYPGYFSLRDLIRLSKSLEF